MGSDTRADALLLGCLVGLLASWGMLPKSRRFVAAAGVCSLFAVAGLAYCFWNGCPDHSQYYHGLFTAVDLMVSTIIVRLLCAPSGVGFRLLESAPLVGAGKLSYSLYLFHVPIIHWLNPDGLVRRPQTTLLIIGLTFAVALLSYYCIERPFLRLKDRLGVQTPVIPARADAAAGNEGGESASPRRSAA
jgi:peptidoglycan/LPS O-acetylase OafA/YrhL